MAYICNTPGVNVIAMKQEINSSPQIDHRLSKEISVLFRRRGRCIYCAPPGFGTSPRIVDQHAYSAGGGVPDCFWQEFSTISFAPMTKHDARITPRRDRLDQVSGNTPAARAIVLNVEDSNLGILLHQFLCRI